MNYSNRRSTITNWLINNLTDPDKVRAIEEDLQTENSQVQEVLKEMAERARRVAKMRDAGRAGHPRSPQELPETLDFTAPNEKNTIGFKRTRKPLLSNRITVASGIIGIAAVILVLLVPFWQSRLKANTIEAVKQKYPEVENSKPECFQSSPTMTPKDRRAGVVGLLPDVDHLLEIFTRGAKLKGDDTETRLVKAKAFVGRARLQAALGNDNAALADLKHAQALYDLSSINGDDKSVFLADIALVRAAVLGPRREYAKVLDAIAMVIPAIENTVRSQPTRSDAQFRLARLLNNRANALRTADPVQAEADYKQAIVILQSLVQSGTEDEQIMEWLSRVSGNLGLFLLSQALKASQAEQFLRDAVKVADSLFPRYAESLTAQDALVAAVINLGEGQHNQMEFDDAKTSFVRAAGIYDELHYKYPALREFAWGPALARKSLAETLLDQGKSLLDQGKKDEVQHILADAQSELNQATKRYNQLIEQYKLADIIAERNELALIQKRLVDLRK